MQSRAAQPTKPTKPTETTEPTKPTIYFVLPCYNEEEVVNDSGEKLIQKMFDLQKHNLIGEDSRLVFVDDGSTDDTWDCIQCLKNHYPDRVCGIKFATNRGHQMAVLAGYNYSADKCDAAISLDVDLQQDIEAIKEFVTKFVGGNDIVYGIRTSRSTDGTVKKATSQLFYKLMNNMGCQIIPNHADYRLVSNRVLRELKNYKEQSVFLRGMFPSLGFKSDYVYFEVFERTAGKSKYSFSKMFRLAGDGITAYSVKPLYAFWTEAIVIFVVIIALLIAYIICKIQFLLYFVIALICVEIVVLNLAILALYISKINMEVKRRPQYTIEEVIDD